MQASINTTEEPFAYCNVQYISLPTSAYQNTIESKHPLEHNFAGTKIQSYTPWHSTIQNSKDHLSIAIFMTFNYP
jgi:hypothetical protein